MLKGIEHLMSDLHDAREQRMTRGIPFPADEEKALIKSINFMRRIRGIPRFVEGEELPLVIPEFPQLKDRTDLDRERARQAAVYIKLGFPEELKMTNYEYFKSLPNFDPPDEGSDFGVPVIVDRRIPFLRQAERALMLFGLGNTKYVDVDDGHDEEIYSTWFHDGSKHINRSTEEVGSELENNKNGKFAILPEAVAFVIARPSVLRIRGFDVPGSVVVDKNTKAKYVPTISNHSGKIAILYNDGRADRDFATLTRSSKVAVC